MFEQIALPTFVIDAAKSEANLRRIQAKVRASGAAFRPHFKTHQNLELGRRFRALGVDRITVSSVSMARFFAADGWDDITIAFPANVRELPAINELAARTRLGLLVDNEETVARLGAGLAHSAALWVKIDVGYHRAGIPAAETEAVLRLLRAAAAFPQLRIAGLLSHDSRSYNVRGAAAVEALYREGRDALAGLRDRVAARGFPGLALSYGDTPSASLVTDFSGLDELRPGNFAYYDLQQFEVGSCRAEDIAVAVACPVVGLYPGRGEALVYGGAVHLSKQAQVLEDGRSVYGAIFRAPEREGGPWGGFVEGAWVRSVSQEHGVVSLPPGELARLKVGELLWICPVHSCLAQHALREDSLILG